MDGTLVNYLRSTITDEGLKSYWMSIDSSIEYTDLESQSSYMYQQEDNSLNL